MGIYLVQHAEARSKDEDPDRAISENGRQDTLKVAELAAQMGVKFARVYHSGKTCAEQTASILGGVLSSPKNILADSRLGPWNLVEPIWDELTGASQTTMLV